MQNQQEPDEPVAYARLAKALFIKVREIKRHNREPSQKIDSYLQAIRERMSQIKDTIRRLDKHSQDLITLLLINEIHRAVDDLLSQP